MTQASDFVEIKKNVGMALVYKMHIQGGSYSTAPFPHNHPYISSCILQLDEISTAALDGFVAMLLCYVISATLYYYDQVAA